MLCSWFLTLAGCRYNEGKPILPDDEFDSLRQKLKKQGSYAVMHEVRCCSALPSCLFFSSTPPLAALRPITMRCGAGCVVPRGPGDRESGVQVGPLL